MMQIVIKMSKENYERIKYNTNKTGSDYLILNGKILPAGHGRLIDADEILKAMNTWDKFGYTETGCFVREPCNDYVPYVHYEDMVKSVNGTPTIIEADKTEV